MTKVGIEKMAFFTSGYYIGMDELAKSRQEDPNKYKIGIGQMQQSVIPASQDVVTLAANASDRILTAADKEKITMVVFGTETGVDNSKAASMYLQELLGLRKEARAFEVKQACYGATAGVQMAIDYLTLHPDEKVLVIGADIARYGLQTAGEVTQGGGAVSMLLSTNPKIVEFEGKSSFHSENIMDFWRPLYKKEAVVDGHYSTNVYIDFFSKTFDDFQTKYSMTVNDFKAFAFHLPYTKMGLKALKTILPESNNVDGLLSEFEASKKYSAEVGNLYTGSLYLSLMSLIANSKTLQVGDRIGLFSYGSGAQGEFFSAKVIADDEARTVIKNQVDELLAKRDSLTTPEYENMYTESLTADSNDHQNDSLPDTAKFTFGGVKNDKRLYKRFGEIIE
ncbi:hydroxymethylglutaryl-CoA synthase [Lentilactobacillus sp. Marseille-Q4993]|uniref:hydroxymethylglutaryl-CoA synthase n=1 Tax=Lentilactobacillus sp. Marseille-Q4993 TaxID=3039492 RepID=UPI0024BD0567|nr:hydroxymethylglutaryl-CoA synthase [Lentilactobacillus sp. Marseille-Q4993]